MKGKSRFYLILAIVVGLLGMMVPSGFAGAVSENIVVNGGAELDVDTNGAPDSWGAWVADGDYTPFVRDTAEAFSGDASFKLGNVDAYSVWYQDLGVYLEPETEYVFRAAVRTSGVDTCTMLLYFWSGDQVDFASLGGDNGWTVIESRFTTGVSAVTGSGARLQLIVNGTGSAWFDDIAIEKVVTTTAGANVVFNPGAEIDANEDGQADGYGAWVADGDYTPFITDTESAFGGAKSLKINQADSYSVWYQDLGVYLEPETEYVFRCAVRTEGVDFCKSLLYFWSGTQVDFFTLTGKNGWTVLETRFTTGDSAITGSGARLQMIVNGTGTAWFDEIQLFPAAIDTEPTTEPTAEPTPEPTAEPTPVVEGYLVDPGVEQGEGMPEEWLIWISSGNPAAFALDNTVSHGGSKSLRITVDDMAYAVFFQYMDPAKFEVGKTYTASVYVKTEGVVLEDNRAADLCVISKNSFGGVINPVYASEPVSGTTDWHKITCTFQKPENANEISIGVRLNYVNGTAWFDDFTVEEAGAEPTVEPTAEPTAEPTDEPTTEPTQGENPTTGDPGAIPALLGLAIGSGTVIMSRIRRKRT